MAEWSQLPKDLLNLIAEHINTSIDLLRFRSVCSTWRSSVAANPHQPPLRFPIIENDGVYTFPGFHLSKRTIFRLGMPQTNLQTLPHSSSSSSDGWLIKIEQDHVTHLLNPLSRIRIKTLPSSFPRMLDLLKYRVSELGHEYILQYVGDRPHATSIRDAGNLYMEKVALCSMACLGSGIDSYVLVTIHISGKLAVFKFRERKWIIIDDLPSPYDDVILFEQKFYAVDDTGRTVVVNVNESSPVLISVARSVFGGDKKALVESGGELLLVDTYLSGGPLEDLGSDEGFEFNEELDCCTRERTVRFNVFRLDRSKQKWVGVDSLGERILFLGDNCMFSASAHDFSGCKGNCIIFKDQYYYYNRDEDGAMKGRGVGVFDLESGSIESLTNYPYYSKMFWPPPTWVSSVMVEVVLNQLGI